MDDYISKQKPELQPILKELRQIVKKAAPQLDERIKYGLPWYVGRENVCRIMAARSWVDLGFYRGTKLKEPKGLLEENGKGMRHIKIHNVKEIDENYFEHLVKQVASLKPRK